MQMRRLVITIKYSGCGAFCARMLYTDFQRELVPYSLMPQRNTDSLVMRQNGGKYAKQK